jgi:hypothetical protein
MAEFTADEGLLELVPLIKAGKLIIVTGSGISIAPPSNLPDWDGLLRGFIDFCQTQVVPLLDAADDFRDVVAEAVRQRERYPIRVASVLKQKLLDREMSRRFRLEPKFQAWMSRIFASAVPNENHRVIVRTKYPFILTSNYDELLSDAATLEGFHMLGARAFTYRESGHIAAAIYDDDPCIIHLHGRSSEANLNRIVFTAQDYVEIKRRHPGFTVAVQTLLLRYSTLFVGYGSSDPHLEDLLEEIVELFSDGQSLTYPRAFILLREDKADKVFVKYKSQFRTDVVKIADYSETPSFLGRLQAEAPRV